MRAHSHRQQAAVQALWYGHHHVPDDRDRAYAWMAVKAMAAGDGEVSEAEELALVARMAAELVPAEVIEQVMDWNPNGTSAKSLLDRVQVPDDLRRFIGAWLVYNGLGVSLADGELAAGELTSVYAVALRMGLPHDAVDALLELVEAEAALRRRRIRILEGIGEDA